MSPPTAKNSSEDLLFSRDLILESIDAQHTRDERSPIPATPGTAVVIPEPEDLDLNRVATFAKTVIDHANQCEDIAELNDIRERIAAIETYLSRRNDKAARALARTDRALEVRIGELLGPAQIGGDRRSDQVGRDQPDPLTKDQRHDFRKMANHQDDPEVADAINSGASRARVLRLIDAAQQRAAADTPHAPTPVPTTPRVPNSPPPPHIIETTSAENPPTTQATEQNPRTTQPCGSAAVITEAARTLKRLADDLDQADPRHVTTDTLRPLADSMTTSLQRIDEFHRLMKDWIE